MGSSLTGREGCAGIGRFSKVVAAGCLLVVSFLLPLKQSLSQTESNYEPPRTADGKPDLQGNWSNASITTLERNDRYANLVLSSDELVRATEDHPQNVRLATDDNMKQGELLDGSDLARGRGYNAFWIDPGTSFGQVNGEYRTSWIVDPANGRIPYSEAGRRNRAELRELNSSFDGPETRPLAERCLGTNMRVGPPMINGLYNNYYQIVQTQDHVVIRTEMISHARIVPLNSSFKMAAIAPLFGESIGHWDGDTLVIETKNFSAMQAKTSIPVTTDGKVIERFTRVSDDQLHYQFTVDDPVYYESPWYGELSFNAVDVELYEFACHEGNYALGGILAGARVQEQDEANKE